MCWFPVNSGSKGVVFACYQAIQNRNLIVLLDLLSLLDASIPGFKPFSFLIIFNLHCFLFVSLFCAGFTGSFGNSFSGTTNRIGVIGFAFYNGLWAYDGW